MNETQNEVSLRRGKLGSAGERDPVMGTAKDRGDRHREKDLVS